QTLCQKLLQLGVLGLKLLQPLRFGDLHAPVLRLPTVQRVLGAAMATSQIRHLGAGLVLLQDIDDLFFCESFALHRDLPKALVSSETPHREWTEKRGKGQLGV